MKEMVDKIRSKRHTSPANKKVADKPARRRSFGYYARRSATFMIALPKGKGRSDSEKGRNGESESWDDDECSIELQLNHNEPARHREKNGERQTEKESKTVETASVGDSDSDSPQFVSPGASPMLKPTPNDTFSRAMNVEDRGYDTEDDESVVVDA